MANFIDKLNILAFIKDKIGPIISITLILLFFSSIAFNSYFLFFKKDDSKELKMEIQKYKDEKDSIKIYVGIVEDSLSAVTKRKSVLSDKNKELNNSLVIVNQKIAISNSKLADIQKAKNLIIDKNLTNEEKNLWLIAKFGTK